jgi:hypothetical protein
MATNLKTFMKCLTEMGYILVHTWYESHGEGGSHTLQSPQYMINNLCRKMIVSFNRNGEATGIREEVDTHNYVRARVIREEIREDEKDKVSDRHRRWTKVGHYTSACCTSGADTYVNRNGDYIRIVGVAGHGEYAVPVTKEEALAPIRP